MTAVRAPETQTQDTVIRFLADELAYRYPDNRQYRDNNCCVERDVRYHQRSLRPVQLRSGGVPPGRHRHFEPSASRGVIAVLSHTQHG